VTFIIILHIFQSFSSSCLCNLLEEKIHEGGQHHSVTCKFLQQFLADDNNTVNLEKTLMYSKALAKLITDYGQVRTHM
jgi:hypothetical protein